MDSSPRSPNEFLASLSSADFGLVRPHLRTVNLAHEIVLVATGAMLPHVYFPHSGIISLVVRLVDGQTIEFGHDRPRQCLWRLFGARRHDSERATHAAQQPQRVFGRATFFARPPAKPSLNWKRPFKSIPLANSHAIASLAQAHEFIVRLPVASQSDSHWKYAVDLLIRAADRDEKYSTNDARAQMSRALRAGGFM